MFSHHHVPSAATFFGKSLFHLSGAINVLLFLVIRSKLLLFPRPEELGGEEIEPAPRIFSDRGIPTQSRADLKGAGE